MKTIFRTGIMLGILLVIPGLRSFGQIGINTDNTTPDASSMLDVKSTDKGILVPRMTTAQRNAINGGIFSVGLLIFNTDTKTFDYYTGSTWVSLLKANSAIPTGTNTKISYDANGLVTGGTAAVLSSADFANQGTTTTVLHGNGAGNPSFGQIVNADITNSTIDLTTKVKGVLPWQNGGTNSFATPTNGGIGYGTGSEHAYTSAGTTGQVLQSNGAAAPTWVSLGGVASISVTSPALSNPESSIISYSIPANQLKAGTTFRIMASGLATTSITDTWYFKVYIGSGAAGTTTNQALAVQLTGTTSGVGGNVPFMVEALVTVRTTGAGGTASILGSAWLINYSNLGLSNFTNGNVVSQTTTPATGSNFATTGTNNIYLDYQSLTVSVVIYNAIIELVRL